MSTLPLFVELELPGHVEAFEAWVNDRRVLGSLREPSSVQVYRDMWGAFT
ncbi:MAG: integrase, partial [Alphaproteobacteria bacterium]